MSSAEPSAGDGAAPGSAGHVAPCLWRRVAPLLLAAALLAWVFLRLDLSAFFAALARTRAAAFLAFMAALAVALLALDSVAIQKVYAAHVCRVRTGEVFVLRGASYLPQLLNYHLGQAWMTWFVSRVYSAPLARVAGATLLVYGTMFGGLCLLGCGSLVLEPAASAWLGPVLAVLGVLAAGYGLLLLWRPAALRRYPTAVLLFDAGIAGHATALAWRLPHVLTLFLGMWLPFSFFGVTIPLSDALAYVPLLMLVGALPLTPMGVGTREVLALELLPRFAPGSPAEARAAVAAATLGWACALTLVHAVLSPLLMGWARILLRRAGAVAGASGRRDKEE